MARFARASELSSSYRSGLIAQEVARDAVLFLHRAMLLGDEPLEQSPTRQLDRLAGQRPLLPELQPVEHVLELVADHAVGAPHRESSSYGDDVCDIALADVATVRNPHRHGPSVQALGDSVVAAESLCLRRIELPGPGGV
jgi:hypothetical protein